MRPFPPPGFPPDIREVWEALCQEWFFLRACWGLFKELYGSEESVKVLNDVAPGPFNLIGFMFRREFQLGISRVTDRKATAGRENLVIDHLLDLVRKHCSDEEFIRDLTARKTEIDALLPPIRDRRHRLLAHLDLLTAIHKHPDPVPVVKSDELGKVIRLLGDLLVQVNSYFNAAWLDATANPHWSGSTLLRALKEWKHHQSG